MLASPLKRYCVLLKRLLKDVSRGPTRSSSSISSYIGGDRGE